MAELPTVSRVVVGSSPTGAAQALSLNPKGVGERSEGFVLAALLRAGYTALRGFGDNERYDLVLDLGERFVRVQVKTATYRDGAVVFATCSSAAHRGGSRRHYRGACELFAVYCPELDRVYLVPVADVPKTWGKLRVEPAKNGQAKGVRWAAQYRLDDLPGNQLAEFW